MTSISVIVRMYVLLPHRARRCHEQISLDSTGQRATGYVRELASAARLRKLGTILRPRLDCSKASANRKLPEPRASVAGTSFVFPDIVSLRLCYLLVHKFCADRPRIRPAQECEETHLEPTGSRQARLRTFKVHRVGVSPTPVFRYTMPEPHHRPVALLSSKGNCRYLRLLSTCPP